MIFLLLVGVALCAISIGLMVWILADDWAKWRFNNVNQRLKALEDAVAGRRTEDEKDGS